MDFHVALNTGPAEKWFLFAWFIFVKVFRWISTYWKASASRVESCFMFYVAEGFERKKYRRRENGTESYDIESATRYYLQSSRSRLITQRRPGEIRLLSQSVVGEAVRLLGFLFFLSRLNKQKRDQSVSSTAMLSLPVEQQRAGRRMHGIAVFIWLSVMLV